VEKLDLLAVALGLAALAGINLYLTVFVTGLAIHFHWITLAPPYQSLEVLGNPWIIATAGVLYFLQFFADKIPWVDSIWDAVHTVIRPIGGALLAIQVLGHPSPAYMVIVALLAGGTSLIAHTAKAATRLASNTSPEPFSNVGLSLGEDAAVLAGLALVHANPVVALIIFLVGIAAFLYFAPKIFRTVKAKIWLAWKKINLPAYFDRRMELPHTLPAKLAPVFARENVLGETIAWAVKCISGRGRPVRRSLGRGGRIPANIFGALIATNEEPRKLILVTSKFARTLELENSTVCREPAFFSENLIISPATGKGPTYSFVFPRSDAALVEQVVQSLQHRLREPAAHEQIAAESNTAAR
jgi:Domain of unknown function (DUF4126)